MDIGNKYFKTKKSLEEYVRNSILTIGICPSLKTNHIEEYNFFIELFRRHPNYPNKIYNMVDISIVPNKINSKYFELNIVKGDGSLEDISWRNCISEKERNKFKCALRVSIEEQIKTFKYSHAHECAICKTKEADEYHVDHENYFEEILYGFLQIEKDIPTIFQNTNDNRKMFRSEDKEFEDKWKTFHKDKACLRILCRSCNLTRAKWKHISN